MRRMSKGDMRVDYGALLRRCEALLASERDARERLKVYRAKIADSLGDEEARAAGPGWEVVKHVIHRKGYKVRPTTYRAVYVRRVTA